MKITLTLANIFLLGTLAACSGGGGGGSATGGSDVGGASTSVDACDLLTSSEVVAAIGVTIEKIEKGSTADGTSYCHWYGNDPALAQKGITVLASVSANAKEQWEGYRGVAEDPVPVFGIGTEAFTSMKNPVMVYLYQEKVFLFVSPLYNGSGIDGFVTKPLAEKALARALKY